MSTETTPTNVPSQATGHDGTTAYDGFTAADHTALLRAVLDRPMNIIKYLHVPAGTTPTRMAIMDAALQVKSFDAATKRRLRAAKAAGQRYEQMESANDADFQHRMALTHDAIADKHTVPDMIAALDHLLAADSTDDVSTAGVAMAREILIDGAGTVYSPFDPANEMIEGLPRSDDDAPHPTGVQVVAQVDADAASASGGGEFSGAAAGFVSASAVVAVIYVAFADGVVMGGG